MRRGLALLGSSALAAGAAGIALGAHGGHSTDRTGAAHAARKDGAHAGAAAVRGRSGDRRRAARASSHTRCPSETFPHERMIRHRQWLGHVLITEYYPAPERWFVGRRVAAPGLAGTHAVDWLYSARGLAMEGEGVDGQGHPAHIAELGSTGWVSAAGRATRPVCLGLWTAGLPAWLRGGWRDGRGDVTFPLAAGGWSNGRGGRRLPYGGVTFASGRSLPLRYYHSIAVDPRLIPEGSRVYIPAYRHLGGGWFVAQDTGGAIKGPHVDVYRPAPASPADQGRVFRDQRIYVIPPGG